MDKNGGLRGDSLESGVHVPEAEKPIALLSKYRQTLGGTMGLVLDHCHKVTVAVKRVVILFLVEALAFSL